MIQIVKASAGTGKTYTLAQEYIRLLLTSTERTAYRHILAVTFTNKATDEMKRRILKELHVLATDPLASPYYKDFVPSIFPSAVPLQQRAAEQLALILHDYSAFAVSTIDKFFQQTLRAFSREIGQFASYQVDLDKPGLLQESVDRVLDALTEGDSQLLEWLTDSVRSNLEQGRGLQLEGSLLDMATSISSEDHDAAVRRYGLDETSAWDKERLKKVRKAMAGLIRDFVLQVGDASRAVLDVLKENGVDPEDSNRGFLKALYSYLNLTERDSVPVPKDTFFQKAADSSQWFPKAKDVLRLRLEGQLEEPLARFCALFDQPYKIWATARIIRGQLYGLGIAGELRQALTEIQKEKNVLSLDDSSAILRRIIDGTDAPFIYEKMGVRFEDFLLDEFQDTSTVQWDNFRPLVENSLAGNFDSLIVGDVKQAIYRWRGSDWDLLGSRVQRELSVPEDQIRDLEKNYRSCRTIVAFNGEFFSFVAQELDRLLGSGNEIATLYGKVDLQQAAFKDPASGSVDVVFVEDQMEEILSTIRQVREAGAQYRDLAILVRTNAEGSAIAQRLVEERIPVVSDDSLYVKTSVIVRRLISQLTLSLQHASEDGKPSVGSFLASSMDIELPQAYHSLTDLSEQLLRELRKADEERFDAEIPYIRSFMDHLQDWEALGGNDLAAFLTDWEQAKPKIVSPDAGSSVRVMTIHKSKGLEFPYVILPYAEKVVLYDDSSYWCRPKVEGTALEAEGDGLFYVSLNSHSENSLFSEDYRRERRLQMVDNINVFYVAMTRPVYGLKVISSTLPKKYLDGATDWKNMAQLLWFYLKTHPAHQGQLYDFSTLKPEKGEALPLEAAYPSWPVDERGRLRFSPEAFDYFGPDGAVGTHASARRRGLVLHNILSGITVPEDLPRAVGRVIRTGELDAADREDVTRFLEGKIASVAGRGWFPQDGSRVLKEAAILSPDASVHRPDRVLVHPDGTVEVIDYKFGAPKPSYEGQVRGYMDLFRKMGHQHVRGYLWFIREDAADEILEIR